MDACRSRARKKRRYLLAKHLLALAAGLLAGCATWSPRPLTVEEVSRARAAQPEVSPEELNEGYRLLASHCTQCHASPPPQKANAPGWPAILAKMGGEAHLDSAQQESITRYLQAVIVP